MANTSVNRKLAAILSADVVGYSRLMASSDTATVETLKEYRAAIGDVIVRHNGRIVNAPGDNILAELPSAVEAVSAAIEFQKAISDRNALLVDERQMRFRVGVNLGDVIEEDDGTIYGDGVNVAARIEGLAEEGGVCISSKVHDEVEGKLDFGFDFLGEHAVKNIERPVRVYRVHEEAGATSRRVNKTETRTPVRSSILAGVAIVIFAIAGVLVWTSEDLWDKPDSILSIPTGPSVAVLPLANQSQDQNQDYFAEGVTEDIITRLSWFSDLRVVPGSLTFAYKETEIPLETLAQRLRADYVLEGGIRGDGKKLRVTVRLFDAGVGANIWANTFDTLLEPDSLFDIQDEITEAVVSAIGGQSGVIARKRVVSASQGRPTDLSSYECVLLASAFDRHPSATNQRLARECLERTIEAEPAYAEAFAALSMIYARQYANTGAADARTLDYKPLDRALATASRAVALEPTNANAHNQLARAYFHRKEISLFRKHAMRAIELNPNDPTVLGSLGIYITWSGDIETGAALVRKATILNPDIPDWYYQVFAFQHFLNGEYAQGLEVIETHYGAAGYWDYFWQLVFLGYLGQHDKAAAIYSKLDEAYPGYSIADYVHEAAIWNIPQAWVASISDALRASGVPDERPNK
jgi:adenylate cyclase